MKGSIFQLLIFLLLFIVIILGIGVASYFLWFDTGDPSAFHDPGGFLTLLPRYLFYVLPLSVFGGILFSHFITLNRSAHVVLSWFLVFAAGTGIYFFGFTGLLHLELDKTVSQSSPGVILYRGKINPFKKGYVYVGDMDASYAYNVVRENPQRFPSFSYKNKIDLKDLKHDLSVNVQGSVFSQRLADNPYFSGIFTPPPFLSSLISDMQAFNVKMRGLYNRSRYFFLLAVAAQVFLAVSCWSLLRISRWPLINALFALVLIRGLFAFFSVWEGGTVQGKLSFIHSSVIIDNLFSLILLVLSVLIILFNSLFLLSEHSSRGKQND